MTNTSLYIFSWLITLLIFPGSVIFYLFRHLIKSWFISRKIISEIDALIINQAAQYNLSVKIKTVFREEGEKLTSYIRKYIFDKGYYVLEVRPDGFIESYGIFFKTGTFEKLYFRCDQNLKSEELIKIIDKLLKEN